MLILLPQSLPALAHALALPATAPFAPDLWLPAQHQLRSLVPAWRVAPPYAPALLMEDEARAAAHVVRHALDRMQRLTSAYGEWSSFDPSPYFDLSTPQTLLLVEVVERLAAVHVTLYADLLLPRVQAALRLWAELSLLATSSARTTGVKTEVDLLSQMAVAWQEAVAVVLATRRLLAGEIGYLAANAAQEERRRWLGSPVLAEEPLRLPGWLVGVAHATSHGAVPSLTLTADFPLPAWRQPGRRRRLVRARASRMARNARSRHGREPPPARPG